MTEPQPDTSPKTWDEVKTTTCYMCACRCGIKVYLKDGTVKYIDGNRDHPVNKGVHLRQGLRPASCSTIRRPGCRSR